MGLGKGIRKGARVVEEARLESVCAARHPEFESLPFRFINYDDVAKWFKAAVCKTAIPGSTPGVVLITED